MPVPDSLELPRLTKSKPTPPVGRTIGTINRITRDLKLGIIDAATAYGSDGHGTGGLTGYLFFLAGSHPKAFASLLGKMLPLQVNGSIQSVVGQVNIVSIPSDQYLTKEDARKLAPEPPTIEHEPQAAAPAESSSNEPDLDAA
ncbi:hypothetical protein [Bradyrhizobium sp. USDA 10063]